MSAGLIFPISECPRCQSDQFVVRAPVHGTTDLVFNANTGSIDEMVTKSLHVNSKRLGKHWHCAVCDRPLFTTDIVQSK